MNIKQIHINTLGYLFIVAAMMATIVAVLITQTSVSASQTCGETDTSIISCDPQGDGVEGNPIWSLLIMAINILTAGIAIAAIGGIVYGAILYATAEDKAAQVVKAKQTIFNVVLGLVVYALMFAFLQFIIPGGVFSTGSTP